MPETKIQVGLAGRRNSAHLPADSAGALNFISLPGFGCVEMVLEVERSDQ